ncbi:MULTISPECIES: MarR family winged helix-turn-helix transcriptional regulator [Streptomyces]|uniref:MarR-family transcriptional regulator n=1 Tax=Streptomyces griseus subsp. griseus (strain JCM 4626 / CBS 651.72 / NBRC 13350 / KCC S-0626 / ISP 5235) TaxID=455632 RepID=B1VN26_STRGG|nr:MarR family transcriptional regulator [Streptomyces griseus]MBW3709423.1 MarR family transcriptional regulator [Streptomyces griseus]BAG23651.1 putative MarR-family transcriptional regulator [Streptomyces griseus subsp. griseus NBRC 13350]SEE29873.1 DNA-binding transcriptional regulator, MarR family [Streptomyces griseus]SQA25291.1 MarR family transcriptional regulator [Streptomyces griseus]
MTAPDAAAGGIRREATESASFIVELLDVMWDHAKNSTAGMTAPGSTSQLRLMYVVDREDGIRMRTVCERLASAPPTVTRMCDRLQALGFLERLPSPESGREITLRLTPTGRRHLQRIREQRDTMLHQAIDDMAPTERRALALGLAGLHSQLDSVHGKRRHPPGRHSAA